MQEESIYNLIPKEYTPPPKQNIYKSKFPGTLPPSCSTFNNHTTSRPKLNNLGGEKQLSPLTHSHYGNT